MRAKIEPHSSALVWRGKAKKTRLVDKSKCEKGILFYLHNFLLCFSLCLSRDPSILIDILQSGSQVSVVSILLLFTKISHVKRKKS